MSRCNPYIAPIAVIVLLAIAVTVIAMTLTAANERPKNLEACRTAAYQDNARSTEYNDHGWITAPLYLARQQQIEAALHDNLAACEVIYQ